MDRLDLSTVTPNPYTALHRMNTEVEQFLADAGVDPKLVELLRLRVSHLNGCAFCLRLHTNRAQELGEAQQRIEAVADWTSSDGFSAAERAALLLADSITRLDTGVPDADYKPAQEHFGEEQIAGLVWAISVINVFNRIAIASTSS